MSSSSSSPMKKKEQEIICLDDSSDEEEEEDGDGAATAIKETTTPPPQAQAAATAAAGKPWRCTECTFLNAASSIKCEMCQDDCSDGADELANFLGGSFLVGNGSGHSYTG